MAYLPLPAARGVGNSNTYIITKRQSVVLPKVWVNKLVSILVNYFECYSKLFLKYTFTQFGCCKLY